MFLIVSLVLSFDEANVVTDLLAEELEETVSVPATTIAKWTKIITMAK